MTSHVNEHLITETRRTQSITVQSVSNRIQTAVSFSKGNVHLGSGKGGTLDVLMGVLQNFVSALCYWTLPGPRTNRHFGIGHLAGHVRIWHLADVLDI